MVEQWQYHNVSESWTHICMDSTTRARGALNMIHYNEHIISKSSVAKLLTHKKKTSKMQASKWMMGLLECAFYPQIPHVQITDAFTHLRRYIQEGASKRGGFSVTILGYPKSFFFFFQPGLDCV